MAPRAVRRARRAVRRHKRRVMRRVRAKARNNVVLGTVLRAFGAMSPPVYNQALHSFAGIHPAAEAQLRERERRQKAKAREALKKQIINRVRNHFNSFPHLAFEGSAGIGRHGGAMIFGEYDQESRKIRKLVIKYSLGEASPDGARDADKDLQTEYRCLRLLRGAEHIVQLVKLDEASINVPPDGPVPGRRSTTEAPPPHQAPGHAHILSAMARLRLAPTPPPQPPPGHGGNATIAGPGVPTFAMEFIPNGTMGGFLDRLVEANRPLPSRALWRIFHCLVRQKIALTYPPNRGWGADVIREEIVPGRAPASMTQNSPHLDNQLIGDLMPQDDDHNLFPIVKLIDFGRGKVERDGQGQLAGVPAHRFAEILNVEQIARHMLDITCMWEQEERRFEERRQAIDYQWWDYDTASWKWLVTLAPPSLTECDRIDPALRDLLCQCFPPDSRTMPTLASLLHQTTNVARTWIVPESRLYVVQKTGVPEDDANIAQLVQQYILDADTSRSE